MYNNVVGNNITFNPVNVSLINHMQSVIVVRK